MHHPPDCRFPFHCRAVCTFGESGNLVLAGGAEEIGDMSAPLSAVGRALTSGMFDAVTSEDASAGVSTAMLMPLFCQLLRDLGRSMPEAESVEMMVREASDRTGALNRAQVARLAPRLRRLPTQPNPLQRGDDCAASRSRSRRPH